MSIAGCHGTACILRIGMLIALLSIAAVGQAAIATSLEPRLIEEMQTVRLTLRATGAANTDALDLTPLETDFEVLGSNTQSQYRSVNGRVESWVEYQISLRPRRTGELIVPSIAIGGERSEAITLIVRAMDSGTKQTIERMIFFESELSTNPVYVQGETILKRRLYYSNGVQIYSDLPGAPEIADAVVIALGDTQSRSTTLNGQRYGVIEQQFAIFPEQSGTLIIPEISITSSVRLQSGGRIRRSGIRISTDEERLEVLPIPAEYPRDQPWLPAAEVRIEQAWAPQQGSFTVGDPVQRRLRITAIGNTGSAIPPLGIEYSDAHFKWYPAAPTLDDDNKGQQIVGTRTEDYSLIPVQPGPAPLAEVVVTWWDTAAAQVRRARVPPSILSITGTAAAVPAGDDAETPAPAAQPEGATEPAIDPTATGRIPTTLLLWLAGVTLALLAAWQINVRVSQRRLASAGVTGPDRPQSAAVKSPSAAWSNLKRACRGEDPIEMRAALLTFIQATSSDTTGAALAHFVALGDNATIWRQLNESVYGQTRPATATTAVTGEKVLQAANRLRKLEVPAVADPLPDLFS